MEYHPTTTLPACPNCHRCAREIEQFQAMIGSWCSGLLETLGVTPSGGGDRDTRRRGDSDAMGMPNTFNNGSLGGSGAGISKGGAQLMAYLNSFTAKSRSSSQFHPGSNNDPSNDVYSSLSGPGDDGGGGDSDFEEYNSSTPGTSSESGGNLKRQRPNNNNDPQNTPTGKSSSKRTKKPSSSSGTVSCASVAEPLVERVLVQGHSLGVAGTFQDGGSGNKGQQQPQRWQYRCIECGNDYKLKGHALRHARLHLFGRIKCAFCHRMYTRNDSLAMHMRKCHGKNLSDLEEGLEIEGGDDTLFPPVLETTAPEIGAIDIDVLGATATSCGNNFGNTNDEDDVLSLDSRHT